MANQTPELLQNYEVYKDGVAFLGVVDAEMPTMTAITQEVKGAGIFGTYDSPVKGQFSSMTAKLTFRVMPDNINILMVQQAHQLELWGAIQVMDNATGSYQSVQHRVILRGIPKVLTLGKMEVAAAETTEIEFEIIYLRSFYNGVEQFMLDKLNRVYSVQGENMMQDTLQAIGLL